VHLAIEYTTVRYSGLAGDGQWIILQEALSCRCRRGSNRSIPACGHRCIALWPARAVSNHGGPTCPHAWQMLAAKKHSQVCQVESSAPMNMVTFTTINQETYSTYLRVA
jgi:hypothetical protein